MERRQSLVSCRAGIWESNAGPNGGEYWRVAYRCRFSCPCRSGGVWGRAVRIPNLTETPTRRAMTRLPASEYPNKRDCRAGRSSIAPRFPSTKGNSLRLCSTGDCSCEEARPLRHERGLRERMIPDQKRRGRLKLTRRASNTGRVTCCDGALT